MLDSLSSVTLPGVSDYDPVLEAPTIERERQKAADAVERSDRLEGEDVKWLMSSRRGRRIVWRLLDAAGVYRSTFSTNSMAMSFAEGNRNAGLRLLELVHAHCSDQFAAMQRENAPDDRSTGTDD